MLPWTGLLPFIGKHKVMADPRLKSMMDPKSLPFDAKRMIYGGFESLVKV